MSMITVAIPVGPHPANRRWLAECVQSVLRQTDPPYEILFIDDSGDSKREHDFLLALPPSIIGAAMNYRVWQSPWNLGVAHAFNCAVGLSNSPFVLMLGSDDTLEPTCLEKCVETYRRNLDDLAYYFLGVRYMDTGETQTTPCHAAMVTKALWRHTGGFPLASASGAPDAAFVSILLRHREKAGRLRPVDSANPLYNYRRHAETDTASKGAWQRVILETRDLVTREWHPRLPS